MHVRPAFALLAVLPFAALASACGGGTASASTTTPADTSQPVYTPPPPTAPTAGTAPPPAGATLTGTGPATPIAPMAAAGVQPILVGMAQTEAQGGQPDGSPFAGQFATGQTLEQTINIKGNGCYTIVAASLGITQLDIALVIQPNPALQPIQVAQSTAGGGPNAILGGKATGCWRNPTPFAGQGKVIMRATAGQGLAAAQVFSK